MRDYETRFVRLEEQLTKEVAELREDFRRRNDAIESFVRQELEALSERIAGEYEGRATSLKEISKSIDELSAGLDQKTHQLEEQLGKSNRELRQQVLTQSKQLRDDMQQRYRRAYGGRIARATAAPGQQDRSQRTGGTTDRACRPPEHRRNLTILTIYAGRGFESEPAQIPEQPGHAMEELRALLLSPEHAELESLKQQLASRPAVDAPSIASMLPAAFVIASEKMRSWRKRDTTDRARTA